MAERIVTMHADYHSQGQTVVSSLSRPTAPGPWPAVVIGHEWWGLDQHTRNVTRLLAKEGYVALAPDLYHGRLTDDPSQAAQWKVSLDVDRAAQETADSVPFLRRLPYCSGKVAVMGFCMGGGVALLAACRSPEWAAAVIYYQSIMPDEEDLGDISCPVLGHYGEEDPVTPPSEVERFRAAMERLGKELETYSYAGASHAFFNETYSPRYHKEASEASWPRTIAFLARHLRP